jgi:adenosylhomocysteinase
MPDGAFLANAGHFDYEVDVPGLQKIAQSVTTVRDEVEEYVLPNGNRIYLLAQGGIINIAGGLGHPIEILDLSFALQLSCLHYVLGNNLTPGFYYVPVEIDEMVVRERLNVDGYAIDIDMRPKK